MAVLVETMDSIYVETEFAFSSNLSKRGIGDDLGKENGRGETRSFPRNAGL